MPYSAQRALKSEWEHLQLIWNLHWVRSRMLRTPWDKDFVIRHLPLARSIHHLYSCKQSCCALQPGCSLPRLKRSLNISLCVPTSLGLSQNHLPRQILSLEELEIEVESPAFWWCALINALLPKNNSWWQLTALGFGHAQPHPPAWDFAPWMSLGNPWASTLRVGNIVCGEHTGWFQGRDCHGLSTF